MCDPLTALGYTLFAAGTGTAVKKTYDFAKSINLDLSPDIDIPAAPPPENIDQGRQNAQMQARRKAAARTSVGGTILTSPTGAPATPGGGKTLLGS